MPKGASATKGATTSSKGTSLTKWVVKKSDSEKAHEEPEEIVPEAKAPEATKPEAKEEVNDVRGKGKGRHPKKNRESRPSGPVYDKLLLLRYSKLPVEDPDVLVSHLKAQADSLAWDPVDLAALPPEGDESPVRAKRLAERALKRGSSTSSATATDVAHAMAGESQAYIYPPVVDPAALSAYGAYLQGMAAAFSSPMQMYGMGFATAGYTTLMIRNVPHKYTRDMLQKCLKKYQGDYDFLYLPLDQATNNTTTNIGYAFINFRLPAVAQAFVNEFHQQPWGPSSGSSKNCEISVAMIQGVEANIERLRSEQVAKKLLELPEWQPLFFDMKGQRIPLETLVSKGKRGAKGAKGDGKGKGDGKATATPKEKTSPKDAGTCLVIRGLPTSMVKEQLLEFLNKGFLGKVHRIYLPCGDDDKLHCGHAFVSFRSAADAKKFNEAFHNKPANDVFPNEGIDDGVMFNVSESTLQALTEQYDKEKDLDAERRELRAEWLPISVNAQGMVQVRQPKEPKQSKAQQEPAAVTEDAAEGAAETKKKEPERKDQKAKKGAETPSSSSGVSGHRRLPGTPGASMMGSRHGFGLPAVYPQTPASPYQGYNPYTYAAMMSPYAAAYQAQVMAAHMANLQAASSAINTGVIDPLAAAVAPKAQAGKLSQEEREALMKQLEFYFSTANLCKDLYLRSHMDSDGWVEIDLVAKFPQVRKYRQTLPQIVEVLKQSTLMELNEASSHMRVKDENERDKWAKAAVPKDFMTIVTSSEAKPGQEPKSAAP